MSTKHETRPIKWIHGPTGEEMFSERIITIEIMDESGGEFVVLKSQHDKAEGEVRIDPEEWPSLRLAIDYALEECRKEKKDQE
jgi:hypothetical protein